MDDIPHQTMSHTNASRETSPKYFLLGCALFVLALLYPVLDIKPIGLVIWTSAFWIVLLTAIRATSHRLHVKKISYCIGGIVIMAGIGGLICYHFTGNTHTWIFTFINALTLLFLVFVTCSVIHGILSSTKIGIDQLIGVASAYILIGVTFAYVYIVLHSVTQQALLHNGFLAASSGESEPATQVAEYFYYSFTSLTTLGYGDLAPISLAARVLSCTEAIIGQLFLTILIARLVGLHVIHASIQMNKNHNSQT
jgi:hypothetical protein